MSFKTVNVTLLPFEIDKELQHNLQTNLGKEYTSSQDNIKNVTDVLKSVISELSDTISDASNATSISKVEMEFSIAGNTTLGWFLGADLKGGLKVKVLWEL